ncbi:MAG: hypothetical protein MJ095_07530 [Oscillospiraceae bacterium]|nr:hypothetical protein [Oscillospiraceae bacterium]
MKYFCTPDERNGTCYYEFQKGGFNENFWLQDSLLIHDDDWYDSGLEDFFFTEVPDLDDYGTTEISHEQWDALMDRSSDYDETVREALAELAVWAEETFRDNEVFSILGL